MNGMPIPPVNPYDIRYRKIFVGGLPRELNDEEFKEFFGKFGVITDAIIIKDAQTQRPRGFGFITFRDANAVHKVMRNRARHTI
jgi:RNA-binding protein Musashi